MTGRAQVDGDNDEPSNGAAAVAVLALAACCALLIPPPADVALFVAVVVFDVDDDAIATRSARHKRCSAVDTLATPSHVDEGRRLTNDYTHTHKVANK